jgi:hypothetical protein
VYLEHPTPSSACPSSLPYLLFSSVLCVWGGSVCPGGYTGLYQGWLWKYHMVLICSPVGLHLLSRFGAGIWWHRSLLVSHCNVTWRNPVWARGSGCQSFDSSLWFFSAKCGSSILAKFLVHRAHSASSHHFGSLLSPILP